MTAHRHGTQPRNLHPAPDHIEFEKSADPADRTYHVTEHVSNLRSLLIDELDLTDNTLVMYDWGGPTGTALALQHPDRVARVIAINTFVPLGLSDQLGTIVANLDSAWFRWAAAANEDGTLQEVLGNAGHTVSHLMLALQTIAPRDHHTHLDTRGIQRPQFSASSQWGTHDGFRYRERTPLPG